MSKEGRRAKSFVQNRWLKILITIVVVALILIEIIGVIGTLTQYKNSNIWNTFAISIYSILGLIITILFIAMSKSILNIMNLTLFNSSDLVDKNTLNKTIKWIHNFTQRSVFSSICYILFTISIIVSACSTAIVDNYAAVALVAGYPHVVIILSLTFASYVHIYSYSPVDEIQYLSTTKRTPHVSENNT
jgi:hypothetical protein